MINKRIRSNDNRRLNGATATRPSPKALRSATGGLVPGIGFLVVFTMFTVGLTILIYATGMAEYSQKELFNIADTTARAVVRSCFWDGNQYNPKPSSLSAAQQLMVEQLLKDLGYSTAAADYSATVSDDGLGNCVVTVSDKVPVKTGGIVLPISDTKISATAVVPWRLGHPEWAVCLATSVGPVYVPAFRDGIQDLTAPPGNQYWLCPKMQQEATPTSANGLPTWNFGSKSAFNAANNWWGGSCVGINTVEALFADAQNTFTGDHWLCFYPYSGTCNASPGYASPPPVPYSGVYPIFTPNCATTWDEDVAVYW